MEPDQRPYTIPMINFNDIRNTLPDEIVQPKKIITAKPPDLWKMFRLRRDFVLGEPDTNPQPLGRLANKSGVMARQTDMRTHRHDLDVSLRMLVSLTRWSIRRTGEESIFPRVFDAEDTSKALQYVDFCLDETPPVTASRREYMLYATYPHRLTLHVAIHLVSYSQRWDCSVNMFSSNLSDASWMRVIYKDHETDPDSVVPVFPTANSAPYTRRVVLENY
jgi:hypothetical protein